MTTNTNTPNTRNLGRTMGQVARLYDEPDNLPTHDMDGSTFTWEPPWQAIERTVREAGFANLEEFAAEVQRRTNARWAYYNVQYPQRFLY